MKRITIWSNGESWMATFHGDADVIRLFGTDTITTAFLARAEGAKVRREIQELNPDCEVILS